MDLQYKWDVFILTKFFTKKHQGIEKVAMAFIHRNQLSYEEFLSLKRIPCIYWMYRKLPKEEQPDEFLVTMICDVYGFFARHLPKIYKVLEKKNIEDTFEVAEWLKGSEYNTLPVRNSKYKSEALNHENLRRFRQTATIYALQHDAIERSIGNNRYAQKTVVSSRKKMAR